MSYVLKIPSTNIDYELLLERRRVYGVTEIARGLGVSPGAVRQWLFRRKIMIFWGYPTLFPSPTERVGGRPVWLAEDVTWFLGLQAFVHLFQASDEELFDQDADPNDFSSDDPRYVWGRIAKEKSRLLAGRYAVKTWQERGLPPLVFAVALNASESHWDRLSPAEWSRGLSCVADIDEQALGPVKRASQLLKQYDVWPWDEGESFTSNEGG